MNAKTIQTKILAAWRAKMVPELGADYFDRYLERNDKVIRKLISDWWAEVSQAMKPRAAAKIAAKTQAASRGQVASWLPLPKANSTNILSVVVNAKDLRRVFQLLHKSHTKTGKTQTKAWDLATFYTSEDSLLIHVRTKTGALVISLPAIVRESGSVHVEVAALQKVKFVDVDEVRLNVDAAQIHIHQGSADHPVWVVNEDPQMERMGSVEREAAVDPGNLTRAFEAVFYAVSADEARVNLNGVYLERHEDQGTTLVATDGHRLVMHHDDLVPWVGGNHPVVLGRADVTPLSGLLRGSHSSQLGYTNRGDTQSLVVAGATKGFLWMLVIPELKVVFPPYRQVIPKNFTHICHLIAKSLREALLAITTKDRNPIARAIHEGGRMTFERQDLDGAGLRSSLETECSPNDPIEFGFRPNYMLDAVSYGPIKDSGNVSFGYEADPKLKASLNPLKLSATGPDWSTTAIVMPMRL